MLTTRAEYRLLLRQDNADRRLTEKAWNWGIVDKSRLEVLKVKEKLIQEEYERVKTTSVPDPDSDDGHRVRLSELIKRPEYNYKELEHLDINRPCIDNEILDQVEIGLKYEGYIKLQIQQVERMKKQESKRLANTDFAKVPGLASEAREKLIKIKPDTLGQASRIPGVNPADVTSLLVFLAAKTKKEREN
jgi:tRNA uridine 5-carboxymethylaminomethyl modification enzyme